MRDYAGASACDAAAFARYFAGMLERGFLIAPSRFEALFLSLAHADDEIDDFAAAAAEVLAAL